MTKHTKHQILGILVIIGLIVLALPLFQRHKNISMDNPLKETPPFPDQSMQVMSPENNDAPVVTPPVAAQTEETLLPLPSAMPAQTPSETETSTQAVTTEDAAPKEKKPTPSLTPGKPVSSKSSSKNIAHPLAITSVPAAAKSDSKTELKSAVWVVQLGSFKNKANALKLVNKLRSGGYHAFMESSHSNITRVLVGPEAKKAEAKKLADQVNTATHLQGMIITYKPLTL